MCWSRLEVLVSGRRGGRGRGRGRGRDLADCGEVDDGVAVLASVCSPPRTSVMCVACQAKGLCPGRAGRGG